MDESIAEKLRAARVDHTDRCFGELIGGVLGEEVACPPASERLQCDACYEICLRKLADGIEAERDDLLERYENALAEQKAGSDALLGAADTLRTWEERAAAEGGLMVKAWALGSLRDELLEAVGEAIPSKSRELNVSKPMPPDADDEPCFLGDAVWHEGRKHLVVAVSHKGKVCIRDWETRNSGKGAIWVKAERVTHRKPDTQEALEADAAKDACTYFNGEGSKPRRCSACPIGSDEDTDWNHCMKAQKLDMLRRQRKLMGGE